MRHDSRIGAVLQQEVSDESPQLATSEELSRRARKFQTFQNTIFLMLFMLSSSYLHTAEGGPCKDYGECDVFKYSLNDIESLQRGASTYINYCYP